MRRRKKSIAMELFHRRLVSIVDHRNCPNGRNRPEILLRIRKRTNINVIDGFEYPALTTVKMNGDAQFIG